MKWTKTPPSEPGWYWIRYKNTMNTNDKTTQIVCLFVIGGEGYVFGVDDKDVQDANTEWAGPIPEPEEA